MASSTETCSEPRFAALLRMRGGAREKLHAVVAVALRLALTRVDIVDPQSGSASLPASRPDLSQQIYRRRAY